MLQKKKKKLDGDVLTNNVLIIRGQTLKEAAIKRPIQKHNRFSMPLYKRDNNQHYTLL